MLIQVKLDGVLSIAISLESSSPTALSSSLVSSPLVCVHRRDTVKTVCAYVKSRSNYRLNLEEREREIVRDKRLSRRERLIGVAIGSKGLRPSILISIIVGPRWNPLSNLSLFLPPSTSTRTPAGHRNYASFHRCYSSLIQIMLRSITEREREGEKVRFIRNSGLEEEVTGSMRVIFSRIREKG